MGDCLLCLVELVGGSFRGFAVVFLSVTLDDISQIDWALNQNKYSTEMFTNTRQILDNIWSYKTFLLNLQRTCELVRIYSAFKTLFLSRANSFDSCKSFSQKVLDNFIKDSRKLLVKAFERRRKLLRAAGNWIFIIYSMMSDNAYLDLQKLSDTFLEFFLIFFQGSI